MLLIQYIKISLLKQTSKQTTAYKNEKAGGDTLFIVSSRCPPVYFAMLFAQKLHKSK